VEELTASSTPREERLRVLYGYVSQRIKTVDLSVGATGYILRSPEEVLSSSYAVPEDKCLLLASLAVAAGLSAQPALTVPSANSERGPALPSIFTNCLVATRFAAKDVWLDPSAEVAPFGMIAANLRGLPALLVFPRNDLRSFEKIPRDLPFAASQLVHVDADLSM